MNNVDFRAKDGRTYRIEIDDGGEEITVCERGRSLGSISLRLIDIDANAHLDYYKITHLALTAPQRIGIGTRCLEYHRELFGMPIESEERGGVVRDDGSHLTEDGPGFIAAMRRKGIVRPGESAAFEEGGDDD